MTIDPLFRRVTLIRYYLEDNRVQERKDDDPITGTGFFFRHKGHLYLATNKHVFEEEPRCDLDLGKIPDEVDILYWEDTTQERIKNVKVSVKNDSDDPRWVNHENGDIDLCLLPLSDEDLGQIEPNAFTSDDFYPMNSERTKVGRGTMVVGYPSPGPKPIKDSRTSNPIAVSGMISTEYGSKFDRQPFFLIDADTYDGMSGSPVVIRPGPDFNINTGSAWAGDDTSFLGIHSGPYRDLEELDLNRVWYPHLLVEIAAQSF